MTNGHGQVWDFSFSNRKQWEKFSSSQSNSFSLPFCSKKREASKASVKISLAISSPSEFNLICCPLVQLCRKKKREKEARTKENKAKILWTFSVEIELERNAPYLCAEKLHVLDEHSCLFQESFKANKNCKFLSWRRKKKTQKRKGKICEQQQNMWTTTNVVSFKPTCGHTHFLSLFIVYPRWKTRTLHNEHRFARFLFEKTWIHAEMHLFFLLPPQLKFHLETVCVCVFGLKWENVNRPFLMPLFILSCLHSLTIY